MSRLYLVLLFLVGFSTVTIGQGNLKKYLKFAQEQFDKGDYYHALKYYEKAMEIDSSTVDLLWMMAETNLAYKDYRKAEYYYAKVYEREEGGIYPSSLLKLGLMQKQNGKYQLAIETFKRAKKKYSRRKKEYLYKKSKQELQSTVWVLSALKDSLDGDLVQLPVEINSKNSEFGHTLYKGKLYFSSLRPDSISTEEEVFATHYKTKLYQSSHSNGTFSSSEELSDLNAEGINFGNGTFSLDGKRFYFSECSEKGYNYSCKIKVAYYTNGTWKNAEFLGEIVNEEGANTTMPHIGEVNGQEVLFFSSNRKDSKGGMDLFYAEIKDGNQFSRVKNIRSINSIDNELSPWWDKENKRLYFSSNWFNGFGGYDVQYSELTDRYEKPKNAGLPINSPANDLYYFENNDTLYFTSNRIGVHYSKNITCCSDIFSIIPPDLFEPILPEETLEELNKRLPVTLYFHNDIPNPRSRDTTTNVNYIDSYNEYTAMLDKYKKEYGKGLSGNKVDEAHEDIESFFIEYVDKGVTDLALFRDLLFEELEKGAKINITIKGFASPLAKTDYNVHLTKRRIQSLVNYLNEYEGGIFQPYLNNTATNGGKVIFTQVPFGEYTANQLTSDNPNDVQNSVYSRHAAIERKIEIQSVTYIEDEFPLFSQHTVHSAGVVERGNKISHRFYIQNLSDTTLDLSNIKIPCECTRSTVMQTSLAPGESTFIDMELDTSHLSGFIVKSIYIPILGYEKKLRLMITAEIR